MPKTRSNKKYNVFNEAIPYILLSKRERTKNTNFEPLHSLLRKGSKDLDISYGWDTTSFYDDEDKLITSGKLIKYEVDTNSNMTRYNKEVFSFKYIKYKDYIISFNECNINIKSTIDINNLLYIGSPEANDELTESNDELTESNDKEPEHNTDNYVLQHQLHLQGQTPQIYHQFQFQLQQQQFYQHSFIQNIVRNEIHTTLLPWIKEYIDFEINKLNS